MNRPCDSCTYITELTAYDVFLLSPMGKSGRKTKYLCRLCANTMAGAAWEYPDQYPEHHILSAICYVGNSILNALKEIQAR